MNKQNVANTLPPKELSLFKRVVKYYDQKQYKNGLKYVKQILSNPKYSEHGETLAMKGILLSCLGKKDEAREYVKRGLKAHITSFVCWHIYGLIHKSDHKYEEAIKCYLQALKLDKDNLQVLRDLSVLQMQLRDYDGCKDVRYKLLLLRPSQKASWVGYALIHHLLGNYDTALMILSEFLKGQNETSTFDYEHSELLLYQTMIMMESKKEDAALENLEKHSDEIMDKVSLMELKAQLLLKLGKNHEAKECCWNLIEYNSENRLYFDLLAEANGARVENQSTSCLTIMRETYEAIVSRYPHSRLAKRLVLNFYTGLDFLKKLNSYLQPYLRKGVPPLFTQIVSLLDDEDKRTTFENLLCEYRHNLTQYGTLCNPEESADKEPPTTLIWLDYLLAQYLKYKKKYKEALSVIDAQLAKTPTLVDFYVLKADVFRDAGDLITASRWMEEAQSLDTADRFINACCTKYMVEAHRLDDAVNMASKFTRGNTSAKEYLSEMQCMWFLLENAMALKEMGKYGEALKLCHEIQRHYRNILDDQLDFHSYCLRKVTLRAYVETLRLEDRLRDHQSYYDVTELAVGIYLQLYAQPLGPSDQSPDCDNVGVLSAEAKKLRNKQRKAAKRAEAEAARARAEQERREQAARSRQPTSEETNAENQTVLESELDPNILARPEDPLNEACKFLLPLLGLAPKKIEVYCLAYEIYERKRKFLLMLKWIGRGLQLPGSQDHPWFHECCTRFLLQLQKRNEPAESMVSQVLSTEVPRLFAGWPDSPELDPQHFNNAFLTRHKDSFPHVYRATLIRCIINPSCRDEYLRLLPLPNDGLNNVTWQECKLSLELLKSGHMTPLGRCDPSVIERFHNACASYFPMCNAFLSESQRAELRTQMAEAAATTLVCGVFANPNSKDQQSESVGDNPDDAMIQEFGSLNIINEKMINGDIEENNYCHKKCTNGSSLEGNGENIVV